MKLVHGLKRFWRRDDGVLSTEAALIMPILLFAYVGLFTFYDAFRVQNVNVRASYTISDMLSRETNCINDTYMGGLNDVLSILTQSQYPTILRVTVVTYDPDEETFELEWSRVDGGTGGVVAVTQATLEQMADQIPVMAPTDSGIIVETWSGFVPMTNIGLEAFYFENFVVTRPRFANQLHFDDGANPVCA